MHELSQSQIFLPIFYKLLLIIETFQFLWWSLNPRRDNNFWTYDVFDWVMQFLKYFQVDGILREDNSSIFQVTVFIIFVLQIIVLLLIVANFYFLTKSSLSKSNSTLVNYSGKILSIYFLLLTTVIPLPAYQGFITAFICFDDDTRHGSLECYTGTYWIYPIISCFGIIILTLTSFFASLLYIDFNPWSPAPFAAPQNRLNLIKLAFKILIPLFATLDYRNDYTKAFVIVYAVIWLLILGLRFKQTPYFRRSVFTFTLILEIFVFWTTIVVLFQTMSDDTNPSNTGFIFWLIIAPFTSYSYISLVRRRPKVYRKLKMKNLTKDSEIEMYIINCINLIEGRESQFKKINLEGLLKYHVKSCAKRSHECFCLDLVSSYNNDEEAPEKIWYLWIKSLLLEALERFPKSVKLHLLYAYVQKEKLDNKFKGLFELMIALEAKPSIEEEYAIFRYKNIIEDEIIENDQKHIELKGIDVNLIVDFENKFVDFQTAIEAAVESHLDFWRELLENNPEIQKLQTLGSYITKSLEAAERQYERLCAINPNHVKMLKIYGNFLKEVVHDENEGQRILDKAEQVDKSSAANRQFVDDDKLKYGDNANPSIVTCSGNFTAMGTVLNANNEVFKLLGYSKMEMIGQNINHVMPKALGDEHDSIMKNYFETAKDKAIGVERFVFPVKKDGYIVPCSLMIKVLPSLSEGLKIVGFLTELENITGNIPEDVDKSKLCFIMYDGHTGSVQGVTHSCKKYFGISSNLVRTSSYGTNDFTIDAVFPELLQLNLDDLKGAGGVVTTINTSTLKENFMIEHESSNQAEEEEGSHVEYQEGGVPANVFRTAQVALTMMQDEDYNEFNLRVIRFFELPEENNISTSQVQLQENHPTMMTKSPSKTEPQAAKTVGIEEEVDRSGNQSNEEMDSSAPGTEFNEDLRLLKDFKALISEKTVPKSIKILRNAVIAFVLIFIVLISLNLSFSLKEVSEFRTGITTVNLAYRRTDVIANIVWKLRKLQLLATSIYVPPSTTTSSLVETGLRSELSTLIDTLRSLTLEIGDNEDKMTNLGFADVESYMVTLQSQIQTGTKTSRSLFSDAVSQFTSHATACNSANLAEFYIVDVTDSTQASFFFVDRNGLFPLRAQSEYNSEEFHDFYSDRTGNYSTRFRVVLILALIVLAISEAILVPIVFSVHKTATKVLSLFGFITTLEIQDLAMKCEVYMDDYLEHRHEAQKYEDEEEYDEGGYVEEPDHGGVIKASKTSRYGNEYLEVIQEGGDMNESRGDSNLDASRDMGDRDQGDEQASNNAPNDQSKYLKPANSNLTPYGNMTASNKTVASATVKAKEEERRAILDAEEEAEQRNARSQKLLNSKDNNKGAVILQFTFFTALIAVYFIVVYVTGNSQQKSMRRALDHLQLLSAVNPDFRYTAAFTAEEIAQGTPDDAYTFPGQTWRDQRTDYRKTSLNLIQSVSDSLKTSFPGAFDSYIASYNNYDSGNICSSYYTQNTSMNNYCKSVAGGLLTRGLSLSQTRVTQTSDDLIKSFNLTTKTDSAKSTIISGSDYRQMEDLVNLIAPVIEQLETELLANFDDYLSTIDSLAKVKFIVFIVAAFLIFFFIWIPYLKRLKEKIFRTKGMLNMIPMNIITKNESLKNEFIQGDILQAVK
jgi:PAS domain S-box-containing protein